MVVDRWWTTDTTLLDLCKGVSGNDQDDEDEAHPIDIVFGEEPMNGKSLGSAVISFATREAATNASTVLHGKMIDGG